MNEPTPYERNSYGSLGSLIIHDVRYDPNDIAYCNPLPSGEIQFRIQTEHTFKEGRLLFNDGEVNTVELTHLDDCSRFRYWEAVVEPKATKIAYAFHFKLSSGRTLYYSGRGITHVVETRFVLDLDQQQPIITPDWAQGESIYQIFPDRFHNGDPNLKNDPARTHAWGSPPESTLFMNGDLAGITQKADYLKELGVKTIYLTPIFQSVSNHKYDSTDYYNIDAAFGGNAALEELVEALHSREMKLIFDASFNHAHPTFFAFQDVIENGRDSAYWDWFTIYDWPIKIRHRPHTIPAERASDPSYQKYLNYLRAIEQNSNIPFYIAEDDGPLFDPTYMAWYDVINMPKLNQNNPACQQYFLDVAAHWLREYDIDGWRMDVAQFVPDNFWKKFYAVCKETKPDCYLFAEIWGDTSHWLQGNMFDGTMNYLFRDIVLDFFANESLSTPELKDALLRLDALYAPQIAAVNQNLLSSHDVNRFLRLADENKNKFALATIFQMVLPGAPGIYYGDEIGMTGGHDPDNRRAFNWDKSTWDMTQRNLTQALLQLRDEYPALKTGRLRWHSQAENAFVIERSDDEHTLLIAINRGASRQSIDLNTNEPLSQILTHSPNGQDATIHRNMIRLPGQSAIILKIN